MLFYVCPRLVQVSLNALMLSPSVCRSVVALFLLRAGRWIWIEDSLSASSANRGLQSALQHCECSCRNNNNNNNTVRDNATMARSIIQPQ